jgi:hypothetical protein
MLFANARCIAMIVARVFLLLLYKYINLTDDVLQGSCSFCFAVKVVIKVSAGQGRTALPPLILVQK